MAQFSAQWAIAEPFWQDISRTRLGPARSAETYRVESIVRHGAWFHSARAGAAAGCCSNFRTPEAIEIALARRELDKPAGPQLVPIDETVRLDAALSAAPMSPAQHLGIEHKVGSIEVGKLSALSVLEGNPFEIAPEQNHKTKVLMTVVNGKVRHGQPGS